MYLALYWWGVTDYFPGVPNKKGPSNIGPTIVNPGEFDDFNALSNDQLFNNALDGLIANSDEDPAEIPAGIPSDITITKGSDLNANFPKYWVMEDGSKPDVKNIFYRMRDKTCQNICDASTLESIPAQFVRANKVGNDGCQYAIKVANTKEFYFYATQSGQNCYEATAVIIEATAGSKDAGWINGPSSGEFYQIGIHDINTKGPGGASHEDFPADNQHLGYMHYSCRRSDSLIAWNYQFNFKLSNWDDGNWGKSIKSEADRCDRVLGTDRWRYEDENGFEFGDQSAANNQGSFTLGLAVSNRCGEKAMEKVLGLKDGSVQCPRGNNWAETDMFST